MKDNEKKLSPTKLESVSRDNKLIENMMGKNSKTYSQQRLKKLIGSLKL